MADVGLNVPDPKNSDGKDKPGMSVVEIRRKIAALEGESKAYWSEKTRDNREMTEDEIKHAETLTTRYYNLKQMETAAERWSTVDDMVSGNRQHAPGNLPHDDRLNTRGDYHQYSVMAALRHISNPSRYPLKGLELEVHDEMAAQRKRCGLQQRGINIPTNLTVNLDASIRWARRAGASKHEIMEMQRARINQRALDTSAGAGSIPTIVETNLIDLLRPRMVTLGLGAKAMRDMQGLFAIPRQTAAATFYMVSQGGAVTATNQTIDQVPFSPHTGGAYTTYTRMFLEQTNQDAEMFVREDLSAVVARGVETAAFNGQANSGWPLGLLNNNQITLYAIGANGGAPTWTQIVSMESYVSYYNADVGTLAYCTDALTRGTLKTTAKIGTTFPIYLWNTEAPDFPINGYPCAITNLLPQNITKGSGTNLHAMIYGNWEDLVYAFWSGLDVIVDPFTSAPSGAVNIIALQDFDVNVRHYQSFCNCTDIVSMAAPII